jgi:hypothetical protein
MSVPGTAADVAISCSDSISTVPGTGPRVRNALKDGTPAHRALPLRVDQKSNPAIIENSTLRIENLSAGPGWF